MYINIIFYIYSKHWASSCCLFLLFLLKFKESPPQKTPSASLPSLLAFTTEACVSFHRECPSAPQWGKRGKTFWSGLTAGGGGEIGRDTHSAGLLAPNWVKNGRGRRLIFKGENRDVGGASRRGREIKGLKLPVIAPQRRA